jgi:hypothetical protein
MLVKTRKQLRHVETIGDPVTTSQEFQRFKGNALARERRDAELRRVTSRMRKSGWHCLEDIATNYGLGREVDLYRRLLAAMRSGKFDEFGLLFLNPDPRGRRDQRVPRAMVEGRIELFGAGIDEKNPRASPIVVQFLRHCWMPDDLYRIFGNDLEGRECRIQPPGSTASRRKKGRNPDVSDQVREEMRAHIRNGGADELRRLRKRRWRGVTRAAPILA